MLDGASNQQLMAEIVEEERMGEKFAKEDEKKLVDEGGDEDDV